VVAFIESSRGENSQEEHMIEPDDLETVIAGQTDTSITAGKCVVVVAPDEEVAAIHDLCAEMRMAVQVGGTAAQGLELLEDAQPDLLIMDLQLPDMHGWEMLGKVKEITSLRDLPIIVIADHAAAPDQQSFALSVAKVDVYLTKPVSMAKLRQNVWMALKQRER
jgi:CheY-like chemotaxis protein